MPIVRVFDGVGVNAGQLTDSAGRPPSGHWELPFQAEAEGLSALRRLLRAQLEDWGLQEVSDAAQLCVGELVANVIRHIARDPLHAHRLPVRRAPAHRGARP